MRNITIRLDDVVVKDLDQTKKRLNKTWEKLLVDGAKCLERQAGEKR